MFRLRGFTTVVRCRFYSTEKTMTELKTDEKTGISVLSLQKSPVNSLNTRLLAELGNIIDELETSKSSKGLIIRSNIPNIFSAGLELMELYQTDAKNLEMFWLTLQNTWLKLFTTSVPTVALINGHAIAGGCLIAMSCEYRVMLGPKHTIGLNESRIGIPAPFWFMDVMQSLIGYRKTERAVLSGDLFPAGKALEIGLVDKVVQNEADAVLEANAYLQNANSVVAGSRGLIKREFRRDIVEKFMRKRNEEVKLVLGNILQPQTQELLKMYFEAMKKKN